MSETYSNDSSASIKLQDPDEQIKPLVTKESVPELVLRLYGLQVEKIKELPSYDDLNFYIHVREVYENTHIEQVNTDGYVLKVVNSLQSSKPDIIDAQHELCKYVRDRGVPTQVQVPNRDGNDWSLESFNDQQDGKAVKCGPYLIRLLTFVPGKIFHETPYIPESFYNVGKFAGRLHKAMEGFHHNFYDTYTTVWSVGQTPAIRDFLSAVTCESDVTVVEEVIRAFEKHVVPNYDNFKKGVIHGDINEQNTVVFELPGQDSKSCGERVHDVSAMLDFNDVTSSYTVFDVAICIAYMSIDCPREGQIDVGGHILAGYYCSCSLNDDEFEALKILICARLCQSLVYGAHSYAQQPENTYLLTTAKNGWSLLHKLWQIPSDELYSRWREIMKSYG